MKYFYHATPMNNIDSVIHSGIRVSRDGLVYMCEDPRDAVKFVAVRGHRNILVCKIKMLKSDEKNVIETFDHSERFFKCRVFAYNGNIDCSKIKELYKYEL